MEYLFAIFVFCYLFNLLPASPLAKQVVDIVGIILVVLVVVFGVVPFGRHVIIQ